MIAMRYLLALICCLSLTAADATQLQQLRHLRQLQKKSQFFQLREALARPRSNNSDTLFYDALVESRFGQDTAAIKDLQKFEASSGDRVMQRKAYEELASALKRVGRYADSARALSQALRLTPAGDGDRADNENARALYESLADVAPQTIEFGQQEVPIQARFNPLGSWDVPVEVNSHQGEWIFDTGANLSTISESEAARMGLSPRETSTYVNGSTGKKNPIRLAVARDLRFGNAHLSNVVFLVISDQALYIAPLKYQIRGILGLPVLRALGCVAVSAQGVIHIETKEAAAAGEPNLFLDGSDPVVEVRHGGRRLQMFLDTGANATSMNPSFRYALTTAEIASLKSNREKTGGVGATVIRQTEVIPTLRLEILGSSAEVSNVSLLLKQPSGDKSYRDGVLGMDSLAAGFTLDFRAMQLRLD